MLRRFLVLYFALWGAVAFANPKEDAAFVMSFLMGEDIWERAHWISDCCSAETYREPLRDRGVLILDKDRFQSMLTKDAADDDVERLKSHVANYIIETYTPENLAEIANFFRTPTGQKMLSAAKERGLFRKMHSQSPFGGPVDKLRHFLSPLALARYKTFAESPAGRVFVNETWAVRRFLHYETSNSSRWPKPPLNKPYIVDILKADGVLKFPNRIVRQNLILEFAEGHP